MSCKTNPVPKHQTNAKKPVYNFLYLREYDNVHLYASIPVYCEGIYLDI